MFIGRDKELNALDKLYTSDKFEFAVIYGRRRVGKTALINQFIDENLNKAAVKWVKITLTAVLMFDII